MSPASPALASEFFSSKACVCYCHLMVRSFHCNLLLTVLSLLLGFFQKFPGPSPLLKFSDQYNTIIPTEMSVASLFIHQMFMEHSVSPKLSSWDTDIATQLCPTLCDPMVCSLPGSSIHGIFRARIREWVAISFSRGSSQRRDQTPVSHTTGRLFAI